jgi:hypothetical protein
MINVFPPVINFFLNLFACIPPTVLAFLRWSLAVWMVCVIFSLVRSWLAG